MAEELQMEEAGKGPRKRNIGHKKGKGNKKQKVFQGSGQKKAKMDGKTKKLFLKRARDYNSDDSDEDNDIDEQEPAPPMKFEKKKVHFENEEEDEKSSDQKSSDEEVDEDVDVNNDVSDDEDGEIQPGIIKFYVGNTSWKKAFKKIIKRSGSDDILGPVLSAHKKLVVKKLAEDVAEKKVKGDAKKEKTLLGEKGHVKPDAFSVPHEKLLMGVATKGVVKLFNAVNKAQSSQKGLNPSRSKDAKVIQKRRKEAFFSELGKPFSGTVSTSGGGADGEGPAWAPLRDNYMLTTAKLKDWDKAADAPEATDDFGRQEDSSSDDDD